GVSRMSRMLKVFASGAEQNEIAARYAVVETYPAFVVVDVSDADATALSADRLVEDITDQYAIPLGGDAASTIDASVPRITARGTTASHPDYKGSKRLAPGPHHYLVQFAGPVKPEWLDAVRDAGGEVVDTYAGFTIVVRADDAQIAQIAQLPVVRWAGHLPPDARVSVADPDAPALPRTKLLPDTLTVEFFTPREARKGRTEIRQLGLRIASADVDAAVLVVELPEGTAASQRRLIEAVSQVHGVRMVRRKALNRISNDIAVGPMRAGPSALGGATNIDGTGEIVAICDTGFDIGATTPAHPDFVGRVKSIKSYPITSDFADYIRNPGGDDGAADLDSGHGTHVAGSVLGDGTASTSLAGQAPIRGIAHKARLVFQSVEQALDWKNPAHLERYGRYLLAGIPADITTLFHDAYVKGARIHSNSWGGGDPGAYDSQSRQLDQFVWDHPTMCILVAAGNDGTDSDGNGVINLGSVTSPGTAKNCITVGASENLRHAFDAETYGTWWPRDYPSQPYKNAPMADDPDQVVAFSSRGPTADGRVKPEVVAPGTWILSTKSTMLSTTANGWRRFPPSLKYFYMGGTSMATPLTAGAMAAIRQHLRRDRRILNPSAALMKAVVIAGALRLPNTAPAGTVADNHQGYGRVDLAAVVKPPSGTTLWLRQNSSVTTGQSRRKTVTVKTAGAPLRIVLAYSDYPGANLVNNLNLVVTAPDGTTRVGNQREGGPLTFDTANNVEVVQVASASAGTWTIDVIGSNVPQGPQRYALAALGKLA
ncbi:MAG TPA: S8 family serine peptidase, partial [Ilumatobacteraceae bacterium]|nr:S8 family serine peptidase [Ilumatobacteraceae bacterium]